MSVSLKKVLKKSLRSNDAHISAEKVLEDIKSDNSNKVINNYKLSIFDLLYHMVFWQDIGIELLEDKEIDFDKHPYNKPWPSKEELKTIEFQELVQKFYNGLNRVEQLIETVNLEQIVPSWWDEPKMKVITMVIQHNSYHLGQIYTLKQMIN